MAQCAGHCVLGREDQPVHFYEIERFISDAYLDRMTMEGAQPYNGMNAAIIEKLRTHVIGVVGSLE